MTCAVALRRKPVRAKKACRGVPPLIHAIQRKSDFPTLLALLRGGAPILVGDRAKDSALHHAVRQGDTELIKMLIQFGADPNQPNAVGVSPTQEARQASRSALLLARGVPVEAPPPTGVTAASPGASHSQTAPSADSPKPSITTPTAGMTRNSHTPSVIDTAIEASGIVPMTKAR